VAENKYRKFSVVDLAAEIDREEAQRLDLISERDETIPKRLSELRLVIRSNKKEIRTLKSEVRDLRRYRRVRPESLFYRGVEYPMDAYAIAQHYISDRITLGTFQTRMRDLGVSYGEALKLVGGIQYWPREIEFPEVAPPSDVEENIRTKETTIETLQDSVDRDEAEIKDLRNRRKDVKTEITKIDGELELKYAAQGLEVRYWEFTRYYRYVGGYRSDWRAFEVRAALPFPAEWTISKVERFKPRIAGIMDSLIETVIEDAFPPQILKGRDVRALLLRAIKGETGWGELGPNIDQPPITTGVEATEETETLKEAVVEVEYTVIDKTKRYSKKFPYTKTFFWEVPTE